MARWASTVKRVVSTLLTLRSSCLLALASFHCGLFCHTPQVEWLRERVDNLSQELVLARRDSGRLAKQLKVQILPDDVVVRATSDPYRRVNTYRRAFIPIREILLEQLQFGEGSTTCPRVGAFCLLNPGM